MKNTLQRFVVAAACCLSAAIAGGDDAPDDSSVTFWGGIEHREFGETDVSFVRDDIKQTSAQLGVDARMHNGLLAGLAIHHGELDNNWVFDDGDVMQKYEYQSDMTALSPYLSWELPDTTLWMAADYGEGEIEITPEVVTVGAVSFREPPLIWDVYSRAIEVGASRLLVSQSDTEWRLKAEAQHARIKLEESDNSPVLAPLDVKFDSSRLRVALEAKHPDYSMNGIPLQPSTQVGVRYYGGNSDGAEVEIDGVLRYRDTVRGLTVEGRAWALNGISEDSEDNQQWSISTTLRLARPDWRGLSFSMTSGYGSSAGDIHDPWREDWLARPLDRNPQAWFYARITYGLTPHPVWTTCPRLRAGC